MDARAGRDEAVDGPDALAQSRRPLISSDRRAGSRIEPKAVLAGALALDAATLAVDLALPAEYPIGALYIAATLLGFWLPWRRAVLALAVVGTVCVVVGYVISPPSPAFGAPASVIGRGLTIAVIWWATAIVLAHQASRLLLERSQTDVQTNEARLRSILDTAPEALITIDEHGIVETFSRSAEALFGYAADEVVGRNVSLLMPSPHRENHDQYLERYLRTGERRIIGIGRVVTGCRQDGSVFPMELAVGEAVIGDHRLFTGFIRDLTARQRIEQELRQSQKMEAVGQLTGGVAHDFNNLLTVITGNLEMLEARLKEPQQRELLAEAQEAASLGAQLTQRLLAFGRRQPLNPKLVDIGQLIGEVGDLLRRTLGEAIELRTNVQDGRHYALVDPSQLQNAILNLAINARDAMPNGGKLFIEVSDALLDVDQARINSEVRIGRYVSIAVTDTGAGMSKEVRERAFEPFFTTKPVGAGTGLGLSMVYGFVKQSGGHAQIYSEPGHGTTVRIYLPEPDQDKALPEKTFGKSAADFPARGETVLVVEDDVRVRRITSARLQERGYRVLEAENGPAALTILDGKETVDLLFTDIVMPGGMNGFDVAKAARAKRPDLKILFTSGYAEPEVISRSQFDGAHAHWIRKPYAAVELARKLREFFD